MNMQLAKIIEQITRNEYALNIETRVMSGLVYLIGRCKPSHTLYNKGVVFYWVQQGESEFSGWMESTEEEIAKIFKPNEITLEEVEEALAIMEGL